MGLRWWLRGKKAAMRETQGVVVQSLGQEDPLEEGMATHSSVLAWRISMDREAWMAAVHRVTKSQTWLMQLSMYACTPALWLEAHQANHTYSLKPRRFPGGKRVAVHSTILAWRIPWIEKPAGCNPWGRIESDTTEQLALSPFTWSQALLTTWGHYDHHLKENTLREGRTVGHRQCFHFSWFSKRFTVWMNKEEKGSEQSYKYCVTERFVFLADASDTAINGLSRADISHKQSKVCSPGDPLIWPSDLKNQPGDYRGEEAATKQLRQAR